MPLKEINGISPVFAKQKGCANFSPTLKGSNTPGLWEFHREFSCLALIASSNIPLWQGGPQGCDTYHEPIPISVAPKKETTIIGQWLKQKNTQLCMNLLGFPCRFSTIQKNLQTLIITELRRLGAFPLVVSQGPSGWSNQKYPRLKSGAWISTTIKSATRNIWIPLELDTVPCKSFPKRTHTIPLFCWRLVCFLFWKGVFWYTIPYPHTSASCMETHPLALGLPWIPPRQRCKEALQNHQSKHRG